MGWTSGDFAGHLTAQAAIVFAMGEELAARVLDAALDGDVVYAAVQSGDGHDVRGLVLILKQEGARLHVKPISEDMGPVDDRCPARILDLLTETSSELARDWRNRCRAHSDVSAGGMDSSPGQEAGEDHKVRSGRAA